MEGQAVVEIRKIVDEIKTTVEVDGNVYMRDGFHKITPPRLKGSVTLPTLEGFIRAANIKGKYPRVVKIISPREVGLYELDEANQYEVQLAYCKLELDEFRYDQYMPMDSFRVNLLTKFVPSKDREALIKYISKITEKSEVRLEDDGVTINTTIEVGTSGANMELTAFSSELNLKPRRTFPDIDQPETKLLFRMKNKNEMALFDFSDGTWINKACYDLFVFLSSGLKDVKII